MLVTLSRFSDASPWELAAAIGMLAVAALAYVTWRRRGVARAWFLLGALAWLVSVALKLAWAIPTHAIVQRALVRWLGETAGAGAFWIYVGALTGVFECGLVLRLFARTRLARAGWDDTVGFGVGFGAAEAAVLGVIYLLWCLIARPTGSAVGGPELGLAMLERLLVLIVHVYACVLVVRAVRVNARGSFWRAFAFKSALDAFAAAAVDLRLPDTRAGHCVFEAIVACFAALAVVGLRRLRPRFDAAR